MQLPRTRPPGTGRPTPAAGPTKHYSLPAVAPGSDALPGLIDRTGFRP